MKIVFFFTYGDVNLQFACHYRVLFSLRSNFNRNK